eukprot:217967-Amorphochlora_amoeboformis.AAC.1
MLEYRDEYAYWLGCKLDGLVLLLPENIGEMFKTEERQGSCHIYDIRRSLTGAFELQWTS